MQYRTQNYKAYLALTIFIMMLGGILLHREADMLYRAQELSLFLPTEAFFNSLRIYPGGILQWLGCYLTQHFFHPWIGVSILTVMWLASCIILCWRFSLKGIHILITLLLPLSLLAIISQTGYWLYYQKLTGHVMIPSAGILISLASAGVYRLLPNKWKLRYLWITTWAIGGYVLAGAYSFIGTAVMMWPEKWEKSHLIKTSLPTILLGTTLTLCVPEIACRYYYVCVEQQYAFMAAMPTFGYNGEEFPTYRLSYYAMVASIGIVMAFSTLQRFLCGKEFHFPIHTCSNLLVLILTGYAAFLTDKYWFKDINYHKEIRMNTAIQELRWDKVLEIALEPSDTPPTRLMVLYQNLAMFRERTAGDVMFSYPNGGIPQNAPWSVSMAQIGGELIYYHYGKENFAYRWCMEKGVETGWTVDGLKLMAKASLINKEYEVAKKYLNLLMKTQYHSNWAKKYMAYLHQPKMCRNDVEMVPILHVLSDTNQLDSDNTRIELYLLRSFAADDSDDPLHQELSLLCAMQNRDIPTFWKHFFKYTAMHKDEKIPLHFQEAAYLYGNLEKNIDISCMPFDPRVIKSYQDFMAFNEQCGNMSNEQKKSAFKPMFGHTFYYFYFLVRDIMTN